VHILRGQHGDAAANRPVPYVTLHRRANADLDHAARVDQSFLDRVIEHRTMSMVLAEIGGPGVHVCVEMHQGETVAHAASQGAQQRQRDAMLAAQRQQVAEARCLLLDQVQARGDVAQCELEIANIGEVQLRRLDPEFRMVAVGQHAAGAPNGVRPIARSGAIGCADIQRDAGNHKVCITIGAGDAEKAR
jgi:hypothetical protein